MIINMESPIPVQENSFMIYLKKQDFEVPPLHSHQNYEMNFVIKGSGKRHVGNHTEDFEAGDLVLLAPGVPHRWENCIHKKKPYSSLVFQWQKEFLENISFVAPEFQNIRKLFSLSNKGIKFDKYIGKEVGNSQNDLLTLPPFEKLLLLLRLLNYMGQAEGSKVLFDQTTIPKTGQLDKRLQQIHRFVEEHYADKISLAQVAALVNMNESSFSRYFSSTIQKPFFSYLNEYRIKVACRLLKETDMCANEVGYACGYDTLQFFYRQFLKYAKQTPQNYRRQINAG